MTRTDFLTARWNNILSLVLGIPALAYAAVALSGSMAASLSLGGFIALAVIGAGAHSHAVRAAEEKRRTGRRQTGLHPSNVRVLEGQWILS